ncbi:MAG TPA: enoyl-CoA hydratase-related protein [Kofleriaceae bacterium]|nr:enoyl-CoA hydratase-related protein [Kofleriaceae bacterium]
MNYRTLHVTEDGPLVTIAIDRPAQLNALSRETLTELAAAAQSIVESQARVVALTGAGDKSFVAGADISEMAQISPREAEQLSELGGVVGRMIESAKQPWIAQVNGFALGGGCELALACDFIYASETAKFGQPEVKLGVIPGFGGTQRLARRVGVAKAKELCMTGDTINAAEALRIGLADAVFPAAELATKVKELAARIASNGPLAVAEIKRLIHHGQSIPLDAALALEQKSFGILFATADQREGMAAFLAKPRRAPKFEGR